MENKIFIQLKHSCILSLFISKFISQSNVKKENAKGASKGIIDKQRYWIKDSTKPKSDSYS